MLRNQPFLPRWLCVWALLAAVGCATAAEQASVQQEAIAKLRTAEDQLTKDQFEAAAELARAAVELQPDSPATLQVAAEILYRSGHSSESLPLFDKVVKQLPDQAPYNWQRGIALCNAERWRDGANQFETHHEVNPDDVENSAWYFLCIAKAEGIQAARKTVIPSRGDGRQPMMSVLKMLKQEIPPENVIRAAIENSTAGRSQQQAKFYADLYVGLYYDSLNDDAKAKEYLQRSLSHEVNGYMADVARVYLQDRFPDESNTERKQE